MSSNVVALAAPNGDNGNHQGHCSRCGKVWTLKERQGVCQWCGKLAGLPNQWQSPAISSLGQTEGESKANGNGNGYDQLTRATRLTYYRIALPFAKSVPTQDTGDLLHTIIMTLADVASNTELSEACHVSDSQPNQSRLLARELPPYQRFNLL